jgi:hypothetical protein
VENIRSYIDILDWVATDSGPASQRDSSAAAMTTTTSTVAPPSNAILKQRR